MCLKFKLKESLRKNKFNLNLKDGLFNNFLKILKKKLKYFSWESNPDQQGENLLS